MQKNRIRSPIDHVVKDIVMRIDAFVFPHLCLLCDAPRPKEDRWFCKQCREKITDSIVNRRACPWCGQNSTFRRCSCEILWERPFARIISFLDYTDTIQTIMGHIKYQGKRNLALYMGERCSLFFRGIIAENDAIVIPIPLHPSRQRKRGYNQAEWFARGLLSAGCPGTLHTDIIRRIKPTRTQTSLDKTDRHRNVTDAFAVNQKTSAVLLGRHILLVDDVITTGATTEAASRVLLSAGCERVTALSLARD